MTRPVDWSTLTPGAVVLGNDQQPWTFVAHEPDGGVVLQRGEKTFRGRPRAQANLIHTAQEAHEAAVAITQVRLGGQVQAIRDENGRWRAPVTFEHPGSFAAHIYIMHGSVVPDADKISDLHAMHEQLHLPDRKTKASGYVDHVHDPEFYGKETDDQDQ